MADNDHRRRGDHAGGERDDRLEARALARLAAGEDWLTAMTEAARELAGGRVRRRPAAGRVSRTASIVGARVHRSADGAAGAVEDGADRAGALTGGSPLPAHLRAALEAALGVDLAPVRLHTGGDADQAAQALGARAFAVGQDIGFRAGAFEPDRPEGVRLIAHEVAHTVQARGAGALADGAERVSRLEDASEREAESFADAFLSRVPGVPMRAAAVGTIATPTGAPGRVPAGWAPGEPGRSLWSLAHAAPTAAASSALGLIQRAAIRDYADPARHDHDPSRLTDAQIEGTNEYRLLMNPALVWQTRDHVTAVEARLTCRLILRALRAGTAVNWQTQARTYVTQAREQQGSLAQAEGAAGGLHWTNQSPGLTNTEFGRWLLSGGPEPSATTGDMNCWELVMFSAFRAGFTTKPRLTAIYTTFAAGIAVDVAAGVTAFETAIRRGPEQVYVPGNPDSPRPVAGDLVIFNTVATHAAVATGAYPGGKVEVMSLWTQSSRHVFRTTVEDLASTPPYRFFSPHW